ncbi:hypothetical protein GCM10009851_29800 [Herbiconiux moechotypicola]|uniref:Uncharacterized protein n=1 Tax=Herbiconiux moechotypicola TaxID=637393 RepID=A0ABN3DV93_9MICO
MLVGLAGVFSAFHIVLGVSALEVPETPGPSIVAMALYGAATVLSLAPSESSRLALPIAAANIAVTAAGLILVLSQLDPRDSNGYATWIVGAVGTLMTITAVRLRPGFAWTGIGVMVVGMLIWARDPLQLPVLGVIGGPIWVGIAHAATIAVARSRRDALLFEQAEQRAVAWHAQEEAEFFERRVRLAQMRTRVAPMLRRIVTSDGELDDEARLECLHLEAAMRDEIRGRRLLDDRVREAVLDARRRGVHVTLLDDGGVDDLEPAAMRRIASVIADNLARTRADRVIVRTSPRDDDVAVTIVGLTDADAGDPDEDAVLQLWLEVPRTAGSESG